MSNLTTETKSIGAAIVLVALTGLVGYGWLYGYLDKTGMKEVPESMQKPQLSDQDRAAIVGENFIRNLAAYDSEQGAPVILKQISKIDTTGWKAEYSVSQSFQGTELHHLFTTVVEGGEVIKHSVRSSDASGSLTILEPEPWGVIAASRLLVKGLNMGNSAKVHLVTSGGTIISTIDVSINENSFSAAFDVSQIAHGEYVLKVVSDQAELAIPIVIAKTKI